MGSCTPVNTGNTYGAISSGDYDKFIYGTLKYIIDEVLLSLSRNKKQSHEKPT